MASDSSDGDSDSGAPTSHGPRECMACRGSGQVISNLGGTPSKLACPWCAGSGQRMPDIDAQTRWRTTDGETPAATGAAPEPAA